MNFHAEISSQVSETLAGIVDRAGRQIPPLWPLASHVAVNPYLGQADRRLAEAAVHLGRVGAGPVTMSRAWYLDRLDNGTISDADLVGALAACPYGARPSTLEALKSASRQPRLVTAALPTIADLAAAASGVDWSSLMADRIGTWAAGHFDAGQALWSSSQAKPAWLAYRIHAMHDITPEIMGLKGFAAFVADAPDSSLRAIDGAVRRLGLNDVELGSYFHQLLVSLGGWAQFARYRLWRAELSASTDATLTDLLAIRLLWEDRLHTQYAAAIADDWAKVRAAHAESIEPGNDEIVDEILQEAAERAAQRELGDRLREPAVVEGTGRPSLQAAFCIDVRSEVFRRALETTDSSIRTLGFAGFFGVSVKHRRFASDVDELRLPVLLKPAVQSCATSAGLEASDSRARIRARVRRAWGRFKLAAVSSFAFVEAVGPIYAGKLIGDSLKMKRAKTSDEPKPHFNPVLDSASRIDVAATVLRAMSLTEGFARIVLLAGHGANVVNNPHASGLHCGACGGYSGDVNARLLADLLNNRQMRSALVGRGIEIPADTLFIAGLHDTTTDVVTLYDCDADTSAHSADLVKLRDRLAAAGKLARAERALRLPGAKVGGDVPGRARDWAEIRPEWGLAGCKAFIAAPRSLTAGRDLAGRTFLHDYNWRDDSANGYRVLELIMTAPVVVASWISLQYYGSTVAPDVFGSGNKLLHNVVGGVGIIEGNGGLMRGGLPWQSVQDGERYIHEPLRLTVCIAAPCEAMTDVLGRHDGVRALFDNRWLHLIALDDAGRMAWRYVGDLSWEAVAGIETGERRETMAC